jgi:CPA2 family monovalent cation:H+ antiporter-2
MPHNVTLITTISACLGLALIMGLIANRLKLPPIVGYLLAGVIIGPTTPGFIADAELSAQLAEMGVILLMFGVGLHFSVKDLMTVRHIALPGAIVQIAVAAFLGGSIAHFWGWKLGECVIFGLSLSCASTVVLIKALEQRDLLQSTNGRIAVGWLIVEDLIMVLVLVLLPPLSEWLGGNITSTVAEGAKTGLIATLGIAFGKIIFFIALMLIVGRRIFPWVLNYVAHTKSRELFTLSVIAVAMSIAYGSAKLFGVSFALGAFFAGMVLRESQLSHRAADESLPFRDAFSVIFFVSVGMLFDPAIIINQPIKVLLVLLVITVGKSLASFLLVLAFRYPLNTALTVSASLAQVGEFSFILAGLGVNYGLLSKEGMSLILAGAIISISLNHLFFHLIEPIQVLIRSHSKVARMLERSNDPLAELPQSVKSADVTNHIVIVGYGSVGKRVGQTLVEQKLSFVVADENRELIEQLRNQGIRAVAGDASDSTVLIQAHVARAKVLVIAIPDTIKARLMIETALMVNPKVKIIARAYSEECATLLQKDNSGVIFTSENELANSMIHQILKS